MTNSAETGQELVVSPLDEVDTARTRIADATRRIQDLVRGTLVDDDRATRLEAMLADVAAELAEAGSDDRLGPVVVEAAEFNAGQGFSPTYRVHSWDGTQAIGSIVFSRFYLGSSGAVHGGALSLWADDLLGRIANVLSEEGARTAYLHVDFRRPVMVGETVSYRAWVERSEGRKRFLRAQVNSAAGLAAEAHGLWVTTPVC